MLSRLKAAADWPPTPATVSLAGKPKPLYVPPESVTVNVGPAGVIVNVWLAVLLV